MELPIKSGLSAARPAAGTSLKKAEIPAGDSAAPSPDLKDSYLGAAQTETKTSEKDAPFSIQKQLITVASKGMAAFSALTSVPTGIQVGLDTKAGKSMDVKRLNAARVSALTTTATASAIGMTVLGPVGLVVGGVVGYIAGTIGNHLQAKSGAGDRALHKVSQAVEKSVKDSGSLVGGAKAMFTGAVEQAKQTFQARQKTGKLQLEGMLDGVKEAKKDFAKSVSKPIEGLGPDSNRSALTQLAMQAAGLLFGTAGVMINAPGGLIVGVLETLKESKAAAPTQMTKSLMLWGTNVGKFLPAAIIGSAIGGPVGMAASTLVGVATASVTSIIDGRLGVNRKITRPVEEAVKEANGNDGAKESFHDYYSAGKGAVVGLAAGVREGWKAGYQGGVEMIGDLFATMPESIEKDEAQ